MKVPSSMIITGSLVTNVRSGLKGVVMCAGIRTEYGTYGTDRLVSWEDGVKSWVNVCDLEWTDSDPTKKTLAIDKILTSLECTAMWLEGGCNPLHAAEELRLNIAAVKKLTGES